MFRIPSPSVTKEKKRKERGAGTNYGITSNGRDMKMGELVVAAWNTFGKSTQLPVIHFQLKLVLPEKQTSSF